jgi:3-phenylpropionate/trans-cinnamate dioxygenase ferredoxin reductase subunit
MRRNRDEREPDMSDTFVIVGGGLAGAKAAETLRAEGFEGRLVLIGDETERPYERPPLSKGYLLGNDPRDVAFVHDASWYGDNNIDLLLGVRATSLDRSKRTLTLDGFEPLVYDKLLLATGSRPRHLDIPGNDLSGVRYLRTLPDADSLVYSLKDGVRVVIIGAGWIGLETAAATREHGGQATVIEMASLPLQRVLGDEVATIYANLHRAHGVDLRFSAGVAEFVGSVGELMAVRLPDGTEIPADVAIVGIGITPNVELAAEAGIAVENGVLTDARLQTSDPNVYACGDVANAHNPMIGKQIRVEHWANALNGGPAAAKAMLDPNADYDYVPYFYSDQYDLGMEYSGYVEPDGYDRVVFRGGTDIVDGKAPEFIAFWVKAGRVLAGMNANVWDVQDDIQKLVRAGYGGRAVDLDRLADPNVPLGELLD